MKSFICEPKLFSGWFKYVIYKMCLEIIYLIYMYKKNLTLNDLVWEGDPLRIVQDA